MSKQLTWLSDAEWARIEPLLPRGRKGAHRVDERRVISGIVHTLRIGARRRDCPAEYGPYTTIYNRFNRWSRQGIWFEMFEALTGHSGVWGTVAIDATHIKVHRSAGGAKGGLRASHRHLARWAHEQAPRPGRQCRAALCAAGIRREHQRDDHGPDRCRRRPLRQAHRRQRLRHQRHPCRHRRSGR